MKKFEYDPEVKILKIHFLSEQSVDSEIIDNLVLDYNKDGKLVKIDIMDVDLEDFLSLTEQKTSVINK